MKDADFTLPGLGSALSAQYFRSGSLSIRENVYGIGKRLRFFVSHIQAEANRLGLPPEELRILDLGCGTGVNVTVPLIGMGYHVTGLDPDSGSITRARELSAELRNGEFICGLLEDQSFGKPFHVVICSEVLEHMQIPSQVLVQVARALVGRGLLLLSVPNGFGYFEVESLLWRFIVSHQNLEQTLYAMEHCFWKTFGSRRLLDRRAEEYHPERYSLTQSTLSPDQGHPQRFTCSGIERLLSETGFNVMERRNNTLLAGNLLGLLVRELDWLIRWNSVVADKGPAFLVSDWLFAARAGRY